MLAALAWLVTGGRMGAMESMPGMPLGALGFFLTVWVVMMAAMMLPAIAPTVLTYDGLREGDRTRGKASPLDATALFVAGYLTPVDRGRDGRLRRVRAGPRHRPGIPGLE